MYRIFLLYAVSGLISLGYQVTWFRIFNDWFGSTTLTFALDYAIYEGTLGIPASHQPLVCSTGGSSTAIIMPGEGSYYYLVVPLNPDGVEGSHGASSSGTQRPRGFPIEELEEETAAACMPQFLAQSCDL